MKIHCITFAAALLTGMLHMAPASAAAATVPTKPHHVHDLLQEGPSVCDIGSWSYTVTWTPITYNNKPWPNYILKAYGCAKTPYTCTTTKCTAGISACSTRVSWSWTGVTADIGQSVSGMRTATIGKPADCR